MQTKLKLLLTRIGLWYAVPLLFLGIYTYRFNNTAQAALLHLYIISLIFSLAVIAKATIKQFVSNAKISALLSSVIYSGIFSSLTIYYSLVVIGLLTWGRVITEELITSYYNQAPQLFDALGLSYPAAKATLIAAYAIIFIYYYLYEIKTSRQPSPQKECLKSISPLLLISLYLTLAFAVVTQINKYAENQSLIKFKEPITLTLWDAKPQSAIHSSLQGNSATDELNQREQNAVSSYKPSLSPNKKNLIIIVVDALRPENMGVYGYARNTTPNLSKLKVLNQLQVVRNVHSSCGESACGLISLASSRYVHELPDKAFTLQQVLKRYGYEVHMLLSGDHTHFYNLKNLYGPVDSYFDASMAKDYYINDDTMILDKTKSLPTWSGKPTMLQYHLMSAHPMGKRLPENKIFKPTKNYTGLTTGKPKPEYTNFYDNGVLQTDKVIYTLIETLKSKHYLENALVIITADHGEALGEHGLFAHANSVREESLNIPLLMIAFDKEAKQIPLNKKVVSQIDIAPTVLHQFGMNIPSIWSGRPMQGQENTDFTYFQLRPNEGVFDHRDPKNIWKYWFNIYTGEEYAYNLSLDATEDHNLIQKIPPNLKQEWRNQLSNNKSL